MLQLTDEIWQVFEVFFDQKSGRGRPKKWPDRQILAAVLYLMSNGLKWGCLPKEFPPKSTVYSRFQRWVESGIFAVIRDTFLEVLYQENRAIKTCFVDATFVRAIGGGEQIGNTKSGKGSKIMAIVNDQSRPLAAIATSAQPHRWWGKPWPTARSSRRSRHWWETEFTTVTHTIRP